MNEKERRKLCCVLTSPELQLRKVTVLGSLQRQIIERREQENGYAFRFEGSDAVLDELNEFIKTERACCPFFTFDLSVKSENSAVWLQLSGPDGVKDFIRDELGFIDR